MTHLHLHIIANEYSGSGNGKQTLTLVKNYLDNSHYPYTIYTSDYAGHSIVLAKRLLQTTLISWQEQTTSPFPLLVVLGGDGTLHEVINALAKAHNIPLGYIPSGSGNDFARSAGLSRDPLLALKQLLETTQPQPIYMLKYFEETTHKTQYITNNLGIGLDGAIVAAANASKDKERLNRLRLGSFVYLTSMLSTLFKQEGFVLTVQDETQTKTFHNAFLVTCSNHPYFGGGVKILPDASLFREEAELIVLEKVNYFKIIQLLIKLSKGKHMADPDVHHFKGKHLHISVPSKQYGQTNGEVIEKRSFEADITVTHRLFWL